MSLPQAPPSTLKAVSQYMKVATEHESRDPVVAYWGKASTFACQLLLYFQNHCKIKRA
jgi:hypothetical protein